MNLIAETLALTLDTAIGQLRAIPDAYAGLPLAPGKWSPKQVIGHLIDSVSNNHQRFVRAQLRDDMVFPGYEQDAWVSLQRYQGAPWPELVELWYLANRHLCRVIDAVPEDTMTRPRVSHNLHEIAWESPRKEDAVTLGFFMMDYVNHMRHHLRQIDERLAPEPAAQLTYENRKSI